MFISLLLLFVGVGVYCPAGNIKHHGHRDFERKLVDPQGYVQRDHRFEAKLLIQQSLAVRIGRYVNGALKSDGPLKGKKRLRTPAYVF